METTKQKRKTGEADIRDRINSAYRDFVLTEGKEPVSVYQLGKHAGFSEEEFYSRFSTLHSVASDIWKSHLESAASVMRGNPEYSGFSGREKFLLFYFSLVQQLKKDRSFICWSASTWKNPLKPGSARKEVAQWVKSFTEEILNEARMTGEVKDRGKLGDHYSDAMLLQFWFILDFWIKDESVDFTDTDALIEKSLGLGFDLLGEGPLEKALDLGRFLLGRILPHSA
jgi:hypothetical protein